MILCLETATALCSVALCDNTGAIALRESDEGKSHASLLTVFIDDLLRKAGIRANELDAVAVSKGPGSYTGLRIGVSTAKGIVYAASIPLIGVETTLSMFHGFLSAAKKRYNITSEDLFCPAIDARRMEIYYCVYDSAGNCIRSIQAEIIDQNSLSDFPESKRIFIFGDGAIKCKEIFNRKNVVFDNNYRISASHMYKPVYELFNKRRFEDIAYFEPFYLKDFITSRPKKNILGR